MKPTDLKLCYPFAQRHPYLKDHIFHVPVYYAHYDQFEPPAFNDYFGNQNPVLIEYCSGNGDWIIEKAKTHPEENWIAIEKRFDRVRKIWSKLKNHRLSNLLIVHGEADTFTRHYIPACIIEGIYINFPDPWPKKRHAKHRLIDTLFLNEMARVLKKGKQLTFVTDDFDYLQYALSQLCDHNYLKPVFVDPYYTLDLPDYGSSWFESLWRSKGKQIFYTQFLNYAP